MAEKSARKKPARPAPRAEAGPAAPDLFSRYGTALALVGLALMLIAFFNPIFFGGKSFQPPDTLASLANQPYIQEAFSEPGPLIDKYPLWTPYVFSGMPSFGSMMAAPYTNPMSLLLSPIPSTVRNVTYYFLLGMFLWFFLRRQGVGRLAALFGAASYVFCTHVLTMIMFGHNSKVATLVWLPAVVLATDALWRKPGLRWAAILAVAVGTMLVTSHFQIAYYTLLAAGLYLLVSLIASVRARESVQGIVLRVVVWAACVGVGFAAGSVLLLGVREYSGYSIRGASEGGGLTYSYATNWSLHPAEITTFFIPSFFGFGGATYWGWMPFTDFPLYMGILPLFLALFALVVWPKTKIHVYLLLLALFALFVAFGKHLPVIYEPMFKFLPFFNKFRVPNMITVLLQFAVAALAALALHRIAVAGDDERARARKRFPVVAGLVGAVIVALGIVVSTGMLDRTITEHIVRRAPVLGVAQSQMDAFAQQTAPRLAADAASKAKGDFPRVLIVFLLGAGLVWACLRRSVPAWAMAAGVLALTLVDLWVVGARPADYHPRDAHPAAFEPTGAVKVLQADAQPFRILPIPRDQQGVAAGLMRGNYDNTFAYFKLSSIEGYSPAKLNIYQDLRDEQGPVGIGRQLMSGNFNVINMLNTKYLVADSEIQNDRLETVHRPETGNDWYVMRNKEVFPRMWFVDQARVVPDAQAHLAAVGDPTWTPRTQAITFEDLGALDPGADAGGAEVTLVHPREIRAKVNSPGNSLLVASEVYYEPGWQAFLDGKQVPIHRVDYALRGVVVPAGEHELVMRCRPDSFVKGAYLSLGAYALIAIAFGLSFVPGRRARPAA